jgi:hypothetical protein
MLNIFKLKDGHLQESHLQTYPSYFFFCEKSTQVTLTQLYGIKFVIDTCSPCTKRHMPAAKANIK